MKENAHDNVFEDNVCSDNTESAEFNGSNVELRGYDNVVRNNQISDSAGLRREDQERRRRVRQGRQRRRGQPPLRLAAAVILKIKAKARAGPDLRERDRRTACEPVDGDFTGDLAAPCAAS